MFIVILTLFVLYFLILKIVIRLLKKLSIYRTIYLFICLLRKLCNSLKRNTLSNIFNTSNNKVVIILFLFYVIYILFTR
jgi:hypothetical protein